MVALAVVLGACSSKSSLSPEDTGEQKDKKANSLEAPLYSKGGSGAQGTVTITQKGDRWLLTISLFSVSSGGAYRLAFFDNGNCSSPNAFSAGKLWLPPDAPGGTAADKWIPMVYSDPLGSLDAVMRLPNPGRHHEEVFRKRSILVFAGNDVQELQPGVPNNVVACGVFDTIQTLF
jgi:Cu/Zn superoxide dismutase